MKLRAALLIFVLISGFISVLAILWDQEFKNYVSKGYHSSLEVSSEMNFDFLPDGKVSYIHFFSEDCRNSRINISHIHRIISAYDEDVMFFIINDGELGSESLREKYDLPKSVTIIDDSEQEIAHKMRVKSLPYALISTADNRLFFGGNYNGKNGLCGSAEIIWSAPAVALRFLTNNQNPPLFPGYQLDFLGCSIKDL